MGDDTICETWRALYIFSMNKFILFWYLYMSLWVGEEDDLKLHIAAPFCFPVDIQLIWSYSIQCSCNFSPFIYFSFIIVIII